MPAVAALATAVPPFRCDQAMAREAVVRLCAGRPDLERLAPVFGRAGVETRYLVHPLEWYTEGRPFDERNREFLAKGLDLAEVAARACLTKAGVDPHQVDHLYFVTTTGLTTPSLDALLAPRLGLGPHVRRSPLFGLGCAGGAGALIRACEVLRGAPTERALVVSVELCSLVFSPRARTPTDLIGAALFGDGAAAVLVAGDAAAPAGPSVVATRSLLFPERRDLMGWDFTADGMRLVLSREIPRFVETEVGPSILQFARDNGVALSAVDHCILHPGGPRVMATYRSALGLSEASLQLARESMRRYGNLSSGAVLFMLSDLVSAGQAKRGDTGLMVALGPGFAAEMLVLEW